MTLAVGDHLVIKRKGLILTPDCGEAYHEYEVVEPPQLLGAHGPDNEHLTVEYAIHVKIVR